MLDTPPKAATGFGRGLVPQTYLLSEALLIAKRNISSPQCENALWRLSHGWVLGYHGLTRCIKGFDWIVKGLEFIEVVC